MAPLAGTGGQSTSGTQGPGSYQVTAVPAGTVVTSSRQPPAGDSGSRHAQHAVSYREGQTGGGGRMRPASPTVVVDHQRTTWGYPPSEPHPHRREEVLPGLLAATRTGLPPAGDDELTKTKIHHGITSRCHLPFCWAHGKRSMIREVGIHHSDGLLISPRRR